MVKQIVIYSKALHNDIKYYTLIHVKGGAFDGTGKRTNRR